MDRGDAVVRRLQGRTAVHHRTRAAAVAASGLAEFASVCRALLSTSAPALRPVNRARVTVQHVPQAREIDAPFSVVAAAGAALSGCATSMVDESTFFADPATFAMYDCKQLGRCARNLRETGRGTAGADGEGRDRRGRIGHRRDRVPAGLRVEPGAAEVRQRGVATRTAATAQRKRPTRHLRGRRPAWNPPPVAARAACIDRSVQPAASRRASRAATAAAGRRESSSIRLRASAIGPGR